MSMRNVILSLILFCILFLYPVINVQFLMGINQGNSNSVTSNQMGVHENLESYLKRYTLDNYSRPVAEHSLKTWSKICETILNMTINTTEPATNQLYESIIFDLGCGVGQSSYYLAIENPKSLIIAIDKSLSRLSRQNFFKSELPKNILFIRGELLDLIPLIYRDQHKFNIKSIYVLYPNPWPKKHHVKRRFHGNPVSIFLFSIKSKIIFRSNWRLYLEEVLFVAEFFTRSSPGVRQLDLAQIAQDSTYYLTPFEKKFVQSKQDVFEIIIDNN